MKSRFPAPLGPLGWGKNFKIDQFKKKLKKKKKKKKEKKEKLNAC
jgi:hypothetical protein